jgi:Secretion system C-terminal sorting domain
MGRAACEASLPQTTTHTNMKKYKINKAAALCLLLSAANAWGQVKNPNFDWVRSYGAAGIEEGRAVAAYRPTGATDDEVYAAGTFTGSITIGGTTYTSAGGKDVYIVRLSSTGALLSQAVYGTAADDEVSDIATTSPKFMGTQYVYICGRDANGPMLRRYSLALASPIQASITNVNSGMIKGILTVGANVYVTGIISGDALFSGSITLSVNLSCSGASDPDSGLSGGMFVARFTAGLVANSVIQPFTNGCSVGNDIAFYSNRLFICGSYRQAMQFRSGQVGSQLAVPSGTRDVFVCGVSAPADGVTALSFDQNDQHRGGSATGEPSPAYPREHGYAISASASGVFVTGRCADLATFDAQSVANVGPFLVKYPLTGNTMGVAAWAYGTSCIGSTGCPSNIGSFGIAANGTLLYTTGSMITASALNGGASTVVNFPGTALNSGNAGFLACYNAGDGSLNWAAPLKQNWGTSEPDHAGRALASSTCGLYCTGRAAGSNFQFGNAPITVNANTNNDAFVFKASAQFAISPSKNFTISSGTSANVTANVWSPGATGYTWSISPSIAFTGQGTASATFTFSPAATTTYTVNCVVTNPNCSVTGVIKYPVTVTPSQGGRHSTDDPMITSNEELVVFPNPTNGLINLRASDLTTGRSVEVFNPRGELVRSVQATADGNTTIDLSSEPSGVYLLKVTDGDRVRTLPVVRE